MPRHLAKSQKKVGCSMSEKDYGFIVKGVALICPRFADNTFYDGA